MSDEEVDLELLELLRKNLGISKQNPNEVSSETGVLKDAEFIYNNSVDVFIDMYGTKAAATALYSSMQEQAYSTASWGEHELHPKSSEGFTEVEIVNFIFTMDLLNYSFWSELPEHERYQVEYRGKRWTGYNSLVACLRRALDEGIPFTTPRFWRSREATEDKFRHVFRSATQEDIPLLEQRIRMLREAGIILREHFSGPDADELEDELDDIDKHPTESGIIEPNASSADTYSSANDITTDDPAQDADAPAAVEDAIVAQEEETIIRTPASLSAASLEPPSTSTLPTIPDLSIVRLIQSSQNSAGKVVNTLKKYFPSFRDETGFEGRKVRFLKRAQILVADLWAATNGTGYGEFEDIGFLTMFADYRVPQILSALNILHYSPPLHYAIKDGRVLPSGHSWETQIRGCSIWAVELLRREIVKVHPETEVNAVLIDFFLYDLAKKRERDAGKDENVAASLGMHHRVRGVWY